MRATKQNRNGHRRRGLLLLGTVALMVMLLAVAVAAAGQKDKDRSEPKQAVLLNQAPTLNFERGTLRRDAYNNWALDGTRPVLFTTDSLVRDSLTSSLKAVPSEGRTAIINGHYVGATLVVRTCTLLDPFRDQERVGTLNLDANGGENLPKMPASMPQ